MIPEDHEPLSLADNVLATRINLCCAAVGLLGFAVLGDGIGTGGRALTLLASALLVFLAHWTGTILRQFDSTAKDKGGDLVLGHHPIPFRRTLAYRLRVSGKAPGPGRDRGGEQRA